MRIQNFVDHQLLSSIMHLQSTSPNRQLHHRQDNSTKADRETRLTGKKSSISQVIMTPKMKKDLYVADSIGDP